MPHNLYWMDLRFNKQVGDIRPKTWVHCAFRYYRLNITNCLLQPYKIIFLLIRILLRMLKIWKNFSEYINYDTHSSFLAQHIIFLRRYSIFESIHCLTDHLNSLLYRCIPIDYWRKDLIFLFPELASQVIQLLSDLKSKLFETVAS